MNFEKINIEFSNMQRTILEYNQILSEIRNRIKNNYKEQKEEKKLERE